MVIAYVFKRPLLTKVIPDQSLSLKAYKEIKALIFSYIALNPKPTARQLLSYVQQSYPYITRITTRHKSTGIQTICLTAEKPLASLNTSYLITAQGKRVWCDYYLPSLHESLFNIRTIAPSVDETDVESICAFARTLPAWVCADYQCEWHDKTSIIFQDIKNPRFIVKAYEKTIFNESLRAGLQRLKNYCLAQEAASKKRKTRDRWVIDIRFKNLMILSRQKGEQG